MSGKTTISGRQIAAGRALAGVSVADLSAKSRVPAATLKRMEAGGSASPGPAAERKAVRRALEKFGVIFLPEEDGNGAGVRLKFTRRDVKQIGRLEGEGGPARDDDVP
jgi:hypothetical protein